MIVKLEIKSGNKPNETFKIERNDIVEVNKFNSLICIYDGKGGMLSGYERDIVNIEVVE